MAADEWTLLSLGCLDRQTFRNVKKLAVDWNSDSLYEEKQMIRVGALGVYESLLQGNRFSFSCSVLSFRSFEYISVDCCVINVEQLKYKDEYMYVHASQLRVCVVAAAG